MSTAIRPDRPSDDITGKSPAGSTGRLKRERPAWTCRRGSSPVKLSETSAPFGQLADDLVEGVGRRGDLAGLVHLGQGSSMISMSRSVAEKARASRSADSSTLDRIGMVLRRSTTLCTWPSAFSSAARSIVSFMSLSERCGARAITPPARPG